jgi:lipopolysaccharide/colanic/teichoic acid biosynthesis glycosyltransferase
LAKRILDLTVAAATLILLSPLWAAIALVIRLTSPGPALFRMRNVVGKQGQRFTMFKFRTMVNNNDDRRHREAFANFAKGQPLATVEVGGVATPVFKLVADPRVTRLGAILRKTGLDEIPQLLNVLRGEMSIVGPRPAQEHEFPFYSGDRQRRFEVLPGITGLHQVKGRSRVPFDEMVRLDLEYVDSRTLWMDLRIMAATVWVMLTGKGAY